jgi:phosphatidate cytidylyltransferase
MSTEVMEAMPLLGGLLGTGGVLVAASRQRELVRRWLSWAGIAVVVCGAVALGEGGLAVLAAGLGVVASCEYAAMADLRSVDRAVLGLASVAVPFTMWLRPEVLDGRAYLVLLLAAVLGPVLTGDAQQGGRRAAYTLFGLFWIPVALGFLVTAATPLALVVAVALADVGGWCGGRLLGKRGPTARKLSALSPNKTWGGVVGGAVFSGVVLLALDGIGIDGAATLGLWAAVVGGGTLGDLVESMVKREAGVKDAGTWLPGFGGLLDRIDSLLFALLLTGVFA